MSQAEEIEVTYTPRAFDYIATHHLVCQFKKVDYAWRGAFTMFFLLAAAFCFSSGYAAYAPLLIVLCVYVVFQAEARLLIGFLFDPRYRKPITVKFTEDSVQHISYQHNHLRWDYFQSWFEGNRVFVLLMGKTASIVIPKAQVPKEAMNRIMELAKRKLAVFPSLISVTGALMLEESKQHTVKYVDASWYMPSQERDARKEYEESHIEGAVFFDIEDVKDKVTALPHMLPDTAAFAKAVSDLGISSTDTVIVYDTAGLFSAARVWWMFRTFGHKQVAVLDGGLPRWVLRGQKVSSEAVEPEAVEYTARFDPKSVRSLNQMVSNLPLRNEQVVDARSEARFKGEEPEPRAGLASGHIPQSMNIYYKEVLNEDGTMKPASELQKIFAVAGVDATKPVVATCGSGVTACILVLALDQIGKRDISVYDGSWAEWGASGQPVATSEKVA